MADLLEKLNKEQYEAATHTNGPIMVFAGAGTGKTRTLIARIYNLIQNENIKPYNILAITFTKKATAEMRERLTSAMGQQISSRVHISTIHSLCNRILRRYIELLGYKRDFEILDDDEKLKVIGEVVKNNNFDRRFYVPKVIAKMIGDYKNGIRPLLARDKEIYGLYQAYLKENNMVDFDDLLILTNELLEMKDPLNYYQELFKYILVDEFQDTNVVQYDIIKKLSSKTRNIFVVGDDDQSIYSFRGACVDNMFTFKDKDFTDAKIVKLEQNYRSNNFILDGANSLIKNNQMREDKKLYSNIQGGNRSVVLHNAYYYGDEARYVVNEIIHLVNQEDYSFSDIAVLYRNNALLRPFELEFIDNRIPYNVFGGFSYLKRKEIKDIISYLRFIVDETKLMHFRRIIDRPARGVGNKTIEKLFSLIEEKNISLTDAVEILYSEKPSSKNQALKEFNDVIVDLRTKLNKMPLTEFFDELIEKTGYLEMLKQEDDEESNRVANLMEFKSILYTVEASYENEDISNFDKIKESLDEIILDQSYGEEKETNAVTISTIHSIKGLEFKAVFVVGLEEGIFPTTRDDADMEEERRVAYVAFTRAKDKLYLTSATSRLIYGRVVKNQKSRFLTEFLISEGVKDMVEKNSIEEKATGEIKVGSRVNHTYFGYGKVLACDDRFVQILFEKDGAIKKFTKDHPTIKLTKE